MMKVLRVVKPGFFVTSLWAASALTAQGAEPIEDSMAAFDSRSQVTVDEHASSEIAKLKAQIEALKMRVSPFANLIADAAHGVDKSARQQARDKINTKLAKDPALEEHFVEDLLAAIEEEEKEGTDHVKWACYKGVLTSICSDSLRRSNQVRILNPMQGWLEKQGAFDSDSSSEDSDRD